MTQPQIFQRVKLMSEPHYQYNQHRFSKGTERRLEEIRRILREAEPLATPSRLQRLDAEAIEDRCIFKQRFGRDWPLRFHREALVQLRQERDWTDGEIKLFLISGMLRRGPFGVRPEASAWLASFGAVLVGVMLTFVAYVVLLFLARGQSITFDLVARGGSMTLSFLGVAWLAYQLYIRPWRIQTRRPSVAG